MVKTTVLPICFTLLVIGGTGCGDMLDPDHPGAPLWSIECKLIEASDLPPPDSLRVAFIWNMETSSSGVTISEEGELVIGGIAKIAQDISLVPKFPSRFTLEIYDLPPPAAMHPGEEYKKAWAGVDIAYGELVVYDDRNGNGKLDMLPLDASGAVDVVLGPGEEYVFMLIEGDQQGIEVDEHLAGPGLNVFLQPGFLKDEAGRPSMPLEDWLKAPLLDITLVEDLDRQYLMCREPVDYMIDNEMRQVFCQPLPVDAEVVCRDDGRIYEALYYDCYQDSVCGTIRCSHVGDICILSPDDPVPSDWPCELQ